MKRFLPQFLKPSVGKVVFCAVLLLVIFLGMLDASVTFGAQAIPAELKRVLHLAPWWSMSLVAGLPGHVFMRALAFMGLTAPPRWVTILAYGTTSYVTACYCVEFAKAVRVSYAKPKAV